MKAKEEIERPIWEKYNVQNMGLKLEAINELGVAKYSKAQDTYIDELENKLTSQPTDSEIEERFALEDVKKASPTRPRERILAYNARQRDRRHGAQWMRAKTKAEEPKES